MPCPETILQNLRDAGCCEAFIQRFLCSWEEDPVEAQLQLLSCQRSELLCSIHEEQKKLECLDYLRYQLQKQEPKK